MPLVADSEGKLSGSFNIPAGVPVGSKAVVAVGSGGTTGTASYVANGTLQISLLQQLNTTIRSLQFWGRDPLAQTFTLLEDRILSGVDVWFAAKGLDTNSVIVQVREASLGIPTQVVIGEGRINGFDIALGWKRILFNIPVPVVSEREYALVFLTDDADHALGIGELGGYGVAGADLKEGWITQQPYQIGELLSSSNASTWTTHPKIDLVFRLLACDFTTTSLTVNFGTINQNNVTDLMVRASVLRTSADTDVSFEIRKTNATTQEWECIELQWIPLIERFATGVFELRATLTGSAKMSPILYPNTLLLFGNLTDTATYVSAMIQPEVAVGGSVVEYDAIVTYEVLRPGTSSVIPHMQSWDLDGGGEEIESGGNPVTEWLVSDPLTPPVITPVGNGWFRERHTFKDIHGITDLRFTRCRLSLAGNPRYRPQVRDLRVVLKPQP